MNIFYLDRDPSLCAQYHCDKHVIKMILESAQLLCNAHHHTGGSPPYKQTHKNHPCSVWVRQSKSNYDWLLSLGFALCSEYTKRYGRVHKTQAVLEWLKATDPKLPVKTFVDPPQAMPEEYRGLDTIQAYKAYYIGDKSGMATWKTEIPVWFKVI